MGLLSTHKHDYRLLKFLALAGIDLPRREVGVLIAE
jgi:hypothetical protein